VSEVTGSWKGSITVIMATGGFKFKAMAFSRMEDPEIKPKLGGAILGVHRRPKEDMMAVCLQANMRPTRKHVSREPELNQETVDDTLATCKLTIKTMP